MSDDDNSDKISLVSDPAPKPDRAVEWSRVDLEQATRNLAANLLRVIAGAGRDYELIGQIIATGKAWSEMQKWSGQPDYPYVPHWPMVQALHSWTWDDGLSEEQRSRMWKNGNAEVESSQDDVVTSALRLVAARLLGQSTQISQAERELSDSTRRLKEAKEERRQQWEAERIADEAARAQRRKTERLYLVDPIQPPQLCDEDWFNDHRAAEDYAAAEERLRLLGFEFDINQNVIAYRLPHPEFLILADLRLARRIEFKLFERPAEGKRARRRKHRIVESFDLRDDWKKDIPTKFKKMVESACERMRERTK
jgi:hypothetical protein